MELFDWHQINAKGCTMVDETGIKSFSFLIGFFLLAVLLPLFAVFVVLLPFFAAVAVHFPCFANNTTGDSHTHNNHLFPFYRCYIC